ncbi:hypothetical protein C7T35_23560 [Variovorax sp. WS11]|nr:hypothetical protein [Variovorax sp. WS11]NDZ16408.1 hypothetical protein [Variovorax sp. WS11]PSL82166.1 hypothetical protein C7T35_23560 [Variovorax sp. WS11]
MDKDSKSGFGGATGNGVIAVLLVAVGVLFVREVPLETMRMPATDPRLELHHAMQDIDARLWQDPFGAVSRGRAEARKNDAARARGDDARRTAKLMEEIRSRRPVEILAVMLPGGPYSENVESRRRARYAVLAGLNASRFSPVDTEHLGYFFGPSPPEPPAASMEPIPYEWFEPALDARQRPDGLDAHVLVVWLQSEAFGSEPLRRITDLARLFPQAGVSWRILGPNGSDGLKAMIDEVAARTFRSEALVWPMRFYSPYATVPDRVLLRGVVPDGSILSLSEFFSRRGVALVRTIGNDARLADDLVKELGLRGLDARALHDGEDYSDACPRAAGEERKKESKKPSKEKTSPHSHIAVVAEWDTLYGRSLRREFRPTRHEAGFCVERFHYVRGLDGQMPRSDGGASAPEDGRKPTQVEKEAVHRKDGTFIERAEGQSQFDYLRRLAVQMREQDRRLRRTSADGKGLRAIGVLGSDVHDKLLVLQALRPEFPSAIFFTTDLDARFLHPREQAWTRNVVVASSFGFTLADRVQMGTPPFRDGYQTSTFLSTRIALDDARRPSEPLTQVTISNWLVPSRIFEIGRTTAFGFHGQADNDAAASEGTRCKPREWIRCDNIHPPASPRYPAMNWAAASLIACTLALALWARAFPFRRRVEGAPARGLGPVPSGKAVLARGAAVAAVFLLLLLVLLAFAAHWQLLAEQLTRDGKPLLFLEGISLWPTEAIRLITLLLCMYLLCRGWAALTDNFDEITSEFELSPARQELIAEQRKAEAKMPLWRKIAQVFSMRFVPPRTRTSHAAPGLPIEALDFWKRYVVQDRLAARVLRTATYTAISLFLIWLVVQSVGEERFVPQRGDLSLAVHDALRGPVLIAICFLIFFVVDATAFCVGFVRGLRGQTVSWPEPTLNLFRWRTGIPRTHLDGWIDLQFIALRTRCVTRLIYYPFIVISLFLLSRSAVFDHWTLSMSTLLLSVGGAVVALGCAVALRMAAEGSRRHAIEQVEDALMRANAQTPTRAAAATPEQLQRLKERIEHLQMGAFAPFWQQPLVKAVLLPFATLGGSTLLDYLALADI